MNSNQNDLTIWSGRTDAVNTSLRYHQAVKQKKVQDVPQDSKVGFGLVGFVCDEGVKRNQGRVGAAHAPDEIRRMLANLPYKLDANIYDIGNIVCENRNLEDAQEQLGISVQALMKRQCTPIIIGGGHETFYGHYLGARKFIGPKASLGIINIDAHFDLRKDETPSSGTMFRQVLEADERTDYLCLGIQPHGNTQALFDTANQLNVSYVLEENIANDDTNRLIDTFCREHDFMIVTLCTDSIDAAAAPGVSAPAPFGLAPSVVRALLRSILSHENVLSFDIAEVNPLVDENNQTVRLAAYILADVIENFYKLR